ncbi:MAG TPA: BMP family ABC transporter substrate-binding protein [Steroidobacteraceae bacterium]|nr:BMP family ABC transporter substrate-binding protein [Steroidobacteraceae bacterium]
MKKKLGIALAAWWAGMAIAAAAQPPLKVAFVYVGPVSDGGWTAEHNDGRLELQKALGSSVTTTYVESVPETAAAENVIRQLAARGYDMVFATSFGYMEPVLKVARLFPKVKFEHATGYKSAPNVVAYNCRTWEGAYLLGVLAGSVTKSGTLGFVGSFPIPEVIRNIDAFTLGARSVNPRAHTRVVWADTWYDPGKERQAAEALIGQGADVLSQNTDSPATVQAAEEKGVYAFGWDSDMARYGPHAQLTAATEDWGSYYISEAKKALAGTWRGGRVDYWGLKEGMVVMTPLNPRVPPAAARAFNDRKAGLMAGRIEIFAGPLVDNEGRTRVPAGARLTIDDLQKLDWYVAGVDGAIPR